MRTLMEAAARDVELNYVTPSWVANHYGVNRLRVYRAIRQGKLVAVRVYGGRDKNENLRETLILDRRLLPAKFPR